MWEVWRALKPALRAAPCPHSCLQAACHPGSLPEAGDTLGLRRSSGQVHHVQLWRLQGQREPVLLREGVQGVLWGSSSGRYPHPAHTVPAPHWAGLGEPGQQPTPSPVLLWAGSGCAGSAWDGDRAVVDLGWGQGCPGSGMGLSWVWMGLGWVCPGSGISLGWVCHRFRMSLGWVWDGFMLCLGWVCPGSGTLVD